MGSVQAMLAARVRRENLGFVDEPRALLDTDVRRLAAESRDHAELADTRADVDDTLDAGVVDPIRHTRGDLDRCPILPGDDP